MGFAWGQEGFIYLSESEVETWTLGSDKMIESGSWGWGEDIGSSMVAMERKMSGQGEAKSNKENRCTQRRSDNC